MRVKMAGAGSDKMQEIEFTYGGVNLKLDFMTGDFETLLDELANLSFGTAIFRGDLVKGFTGEMHIAPETPFTRASSLALGRSSGSLPSPGRIMQHPDEPVLYDTESLSCKRP